MATSQDFSETGTIQTYTVTAPGEYQIVAEGAAGGAGSNGQNPGGEGAEVGGTFNLTSGEQLEVVVGGAGGESNDGGGGGGFSEVLESTDGGKTYDVLLVAGGGGGGGAIDGNDAASPGGSATVASAGSGVGGAAGVGPGGGGGGAGEASNGGSAGGSGAGGGGADVANGAGGGHAVIGAHGGFGGGGGGGTGGGGGGGYTGGAGGATNVAGDGGGGGTSYDGGTPIAADTLSNVSSGNGSVSITPVCFTTGTRILTARGNLPVEDLVIGDEAVTASGATRPIIWIGSRTLFTALRESSPVHIREGAFGAGRPERDLFLSPGHPVLVGDDDGQGGHLVPIMCLINGTTIERVPVDSVTYWHVELSQHDILLAEGLPAESYIDLGSKVWFDGVDGPLFDPDTAARGDGRCRLVSTDGPVVDVERQRLDGVFAQTLQDQCDWSSDLDQMTC